jgi:hypothetical protein
MGYISAIAGGSDTFSMTNFPGNDDSLSAAVFAPMVTSPPSIVIQPQSTEVFSNATAQFTVTAAGLAPLSYQWYTTSSSTLPLANAVALSNGSKYNGSTNATLTISNVTTINLTNYAVIITNSLGSITSSIANLAYWPSPVLQLRMPFTDAPGGTTTASDTSGGGIDITMNMFTNGTVADDLHGAAGTGVTILDPNAGALDMTTNIDPAQGINQPNNNAGDIVDLLGSTTLATLGGGGNITNFTATIWAKWSVPFNAGAGAGAPRLWILNAGGAGLDLAGANTLGFQFLNTNQVQFGYPGNTVNITLPSNFQVNQWYYFALTYDGSNFKAYYGTDTSAARLINTTAVSGQVVALGSSASLAIGNRANNFNRGLNGWLEDFRFYNNPGDSNFVESVRASLAPLSVPIITTQPTATTVVFAGRTVQFAVAASGVAPLAYQWVRAGTNLIDAANYISGSISNVLTLTGVTAADTTNYSVIVTNLDGAVTSSVASLSVVLPNAYESAVLTNGTAPFAFYTFSEISDPSAGNAEAYDSMGVFNGTYGTGSENGYDGIAGPQATADGLTGFPDTNTALGAFWNNSPPDSYVTAPPFNLNNGVGTNVLTITAWIYPTDPQVKGAGIVFSRSGTTTSGLAYDDFTNSDGSYRLGYNWNNEAGAYSWDSGLTPPQNMWSLVALVVTSTNNTVYLINANGLQFATHVYNHVNQKFEGPTLIGGDSFSTTGQRNFNGSIDEVALFSQALTLNQMIALFAAGSGITLVPPLPTVSGAVWSPATNYPGESASATVTATNAIFYQWKAGLNGNYTNLVDGANISGSATPTLTINSVQFTNALDYVVVVTNTAGAATSAPPATLYVLTPGPATNFTLNYGGTPIVQPIGSDWNTITNWDPLGLSATVSMLANPGSSFELPTGSRLRTPTTAGVQLFPGVQLSVDGSGVFENGTVINVSELRFKNGAATPINYFSRLVLNGGELDQGVGATEVIQGTMNVASSSIIYVDSTSAQDRGYQIDSWLTGSGDLFWHEWSGGLGGINLQVTGTTNTFSGQWIVDQGALVGVGTNSLGTNNIIVGTNGLTAAVETLYNINNPNASLILGANGQMFLHQNDRFGSVIINGTSLTNGTYSYGTLNAVYPANFPLIWVQQAGFTVTGASGQITVGSFMVPPPSSPHITGIHVSGTALSISATNGKAGGLWILLQSTNVTLPLIQWQTNLTGNFDGGGNLSTNIVNTATNRQEFYIFKVQ